MQKEARKVPVGGTRINPAAGLDKLESFSAWQREHETNGSESEKQGESESEPQKQAGGVCHPGAQQFQCSPGRKGKSLFGEARVLQVTLKKGSDSLKCSFIPTF